MSSPVVAMLWENWRLIHAEVAWRLSLGIVGGLVMFVLVAAAAPNQVGVPMVSQAALGAAVYVVSALVLRLTLDYPFPLLSVAAPIAAGHLVRTIRSRVGAMSANDLVVLAFVTCTLVAVMVAWRAADAALRARYQRRQRLAGSLLLLYALALGLLALAGERGIGREIPLGKILEATKWNAAAATVLATGYLFWRVFEERLLKLRQACSAILFSAAFGVACVKVLSATGVSLAGMPTTDAAWKLSPALLPLLVSVLAPWSLSRIRHA